MVAEATLPAKTLKKGSRDVLNLFGNRITQRLGLEELLNHRRSISLDNNPGQELLGIKGDQVIATRLYLVNQQLYILFASAERMDDVNTFLSSFQLQ